MPTDREFDRTYDGTFIDDRCHFCNHDKHTHQTKSIWYKRTKKDKAEEEVRR